MYCFFILIQKRYNKDINQNQSNAPNIIQYNNVQNPSINQQNRDEILPQKHDRRTSPNLQVNIVQSESVALIINPK